MRVVVVGTSGSGKTTFAESLSQRLDLPHIELDALYWGPNWTERPAEEFRAGVARAIAAPSWICDGNYSRVREIVWLRATTLVWLNYSFPVVFSRAVYRTVARAITRKRLYAGNQESLCLIVDPDWIPWWVIRTFRRRRREYGALLRGPQFKHLDVVEFRKPREAEAFLVAAWDGKACRSET
jgi:adenylate kinase family enzyme